MGENYSHNCNINWLIDIFFSSRININSNFNGFILAPAYRRGGKKFLFQQGAECLVIYECYVISFKWMWESNVRLPSAHHMTHITKSITINCFFYSAKTCVLKALWRIQMNSQFIYELNNRLVVDDAILYIAISNHNTCRLIFLKKLHYLSYWHPSMTVSTQVWPKYDPSHDSIDPAYQSH